MITILLTLFFASNPQIDAHCQWMTREHHATVEVKGICQNEIILSFRCPPKTALEPLLRKGVKDLLTRLGPPFEVKHLRYRLNSGTTQLLLATPPYEPPTLYRFTGKKTTKRRYL